MTCSVPLPAPEDVLPRILAIGEEYEFATFLIGVRAEGAGTHAEGSRTGRPLKEALGAMLERRLWPARTVDFRRPEIQIHIDAATGAVAAVPAPLFVGGRYVKLARTLSSTHWHHFGCGGRGCPVCGFRGHFAEGSVGELIGRPLQAAAGGAKYYFHGAGREDVDVRMLGTGRPFIVEIAAPRRRRLPYERLAAEINAAARNLAAGAGPLRPATAAMVPAIKEAGGDKTYLATATAARPLPPDAAARVAALTGAVVAQETPHRVRHRRAELVRTRTIAESFATVLDARSFIWQVRAGAGTYIKELASGDGGRTRPSLAEALGVPVVIVDLDVAAVHCRAPWEEDGGDGRQADGCGRLDEAAEPPRRIA